MSIFVIKRNNESLDRLLQVQTILTYPAVQSLDTWILQDVEATSSWFFDLDIDQFEKMSRSQQGFVTSNNAFFTFWRSLTDIRSGTIIAISSNNSFLIPFIVLEEFDSSKWILASHLEELRQQLFLEGWKSSQYFPQYRNFLIGSCTGTDVCDMFPLPGVPFPCSGSLLRQDSP